MRVVFVVVVVVLAVVVLVLVYSVWMVVVVLGCDYGAGVSVCICFRTFALLAYFCPALIAVDSEARYAYGPWCSHRREVKLMTHRSRVGALVSMVSYRR